LTSLVVVPGLGEMVGAGFVAGNVAEATGALVGGSVDVTNSTPGAAGAAGVTSHPEVNAMTAEHRMNILRMSV
jgi:hypothetical protein